MVIEEERRLDVDHPPIKWEEDMPPIPIGKAPPPIYIDRKEQPPKDNKERIWDCWMTDTST